MKVLILSCNTGQGHNTAGKALVEYFSDRGYTCEMRDALEFASKKTSRIVSNAYIKLATHSPAIFGLAYYAGGKISSDKHKSVVYGANIRYANRLGRYIVQQKFDAVVMPHLFPAEAVTYLRRKHKLEDVRLYAVATDYACIPFWEETELDGYFIPHEDLTEEFIRRGISRNKLIPTGIPVSKRFSLPADRAHARTILNFSGVRRIYLVMTGSMGFGNVQALSDGLLSLCGDDDRIIVMGGNNTKLKEKLRRRYADEPRVLVLDFTREVDRYMQACDVLFTKPGGLTSTEAAVRNVPLIHTAPIPGCETINADFFSSRGLSFCLRNMGELESLVKSLTEEEPVRQKMLEAQRREINAFAGDGICDYIEAHKR